VDFYSIYERYYSRVRSFILKIVRDEWIADDLVQETFTRVITHMNEVRDSNSLSAWIFRIAYNLCQDYFRSPATRNLETSKNPEIAAPGIVPPHQGMEQSEMSACVQIHMQRLSEPLLAVLTLYDMFGFKQAEIAGIIGISVANVKVRLHRARNKFREVLKAECAFEKDQRGILTCVPKEDGEILEAMGDQ
jgi:RNA polymerase sigma-70 factor (ECF subfamily)